MSVSVTSILQTIAIDLNDTGHPLGRIYSRAEQGHGAGLHRNERLVDERAVILIPHVRLCDTWGPLGIGLTHDAPDTTKRDWLTKHGSRWVIRRAGEAREVAL
jgi:hypothetical protein